MIHLFQCIFIAFVTIAWKNSENPPLDSALNHSVGNVCSFARAMYSTGGPWNTLSEEEEERGGERDGDGDVRGGDGEEQDRGEDDEQANEGGDDEGENREGDNDE